ncbi:hypothetical protein Pcinc_001996 [Petrolisthes cinctipes]|uniref:Uncharacterized protein n=1 Tax=Petrolisthes cinctipes TaxID=88211 RepID=A0AAE1L2M8_PETCI|nr:hypothetical protein Pcinc_001996 [Petrolisthes cinctipes]
MAKCAELEKRINQKFTEFEEKLEKRFQNIEKDMQDKVNKKDIQQMIAVELAKHGQTDDINWPLPGSVLSRDQMEVKIKDVKEVARELLQNQLNKEEIKTIIRLGKGDERNARPILVTLENHQIKKCIFSNME